MNVSTIDFYNKNAQSYADSTISLDMSNLQEKFIARLPAKARILDAGCGSGRDSLLFKSKGFSVTAMDASSELAKLASATLGQQVICQSFADINWLCEFDGVWCMASMLHLNDAELKVALYECASSLKQGGVFFASFKTGNGEGYDDKGRFFNYHSMESLRAAFEAEALLKNVTFEYNQDSMGRTDTQWISVFAEGI